MAIENQLEQQEDITSLFKLVDSSNVDKFKKGLEDFDNENPIPEKNTTTVETKESQNSLTEAEELATETLYAIQTEVNNLGIFNPPVDLNKAIGLLSPEMVQYWVSYKTDFWPKELKEMFPEAKQSKKNPRTANFVADLLSLSVHLKQSLVDAEQVKLSDRPTLKTPSMEVTKDLMEIMKTNFPEFHGEKIVAIITETLAQQAKGKTEWPKQEAMAVADKLLSTSSVTAS